MSETLLELVDDFNKISRAILKDFEEGNESGESLQLELQALNLTIKDKVDGYKYALDRLKDEADYWKERGKKATGISKAITTGTDYIKARLKFAMEQLEAPEVLGNEFKFKIVTNPPRVEIDNVELIPQKYKILKTIVEVDKISLKEDLKKGEKIDGAHLETGESVRAYVNRKK